MKYLLLCLVLTSTTLFADEMRQLSDFDQVSAATGIKVILIKSSETKANVEVENGDTDDVLTEVKGSKLVIKFDNNQGWSRSNRNRKATVTVYYKFIEAVHVSSGAIVKAENSIEAADLQLEGSSGGIMELEVKASNLSVDISSGGILRITGSTEALDVDVSSGGVLKGQDLRSQSASADASSGGVATFHVAKNLDADASSGGSIRYLGDPDKVRSNSSSAGSIRAQS